MTKKEKTHVRLDEVTAPKCSGRVELNGDGIGYVEAWDFSRANLNQEHRIYYISQVASICYANPKALGSISLYDRLATENKGLPSSSYEFVPVLLDMYTLEQESFYACSKYGEMVEHAGMSYLLTNLRALIADVDDRADQFYNTEEECEIIAKHFKVFKSKIDLVTARQFMRHRVSWQELSRRYVSGKRSAFEFYISPKMREVYDDYSAYGTFDGPGTVPYSKEYFEQVIDIYDDAMSRGVKPEEARRVLPQTMYTTVWSAWQPNQLDVLIKLRTDSHAQSEIQDLTRGIVELACP